MGRSVAASAAKRREEERPRIIGGLFRFCPMHDDRIDSNVCEVRQTRYPKGCHGCPDRRRA
ncbi:MAG: hypothetical protein WC291_00920 [Thermodesulfovibrionales bacterium]|jgi:hypothetical protein